VRVDRARLLQAVGVAAVLMAWQLAGARAPGFYSQPLRVLHALAALASEEELVPLVLTSLGSLVLGLALSFVAGVGLGLLIGRYRLVAVALEPYLAAFYAVPSVALVPVMVVWFGIGSRFVIASIVMAASVLLVFATATGVRETGRAYFEVARSLGLTGRQVLLQVLLPGALPYIVTGVRLAVARGLVSLIVAQYLVSWPGIGTLLKNAQVNLQTDRMFAMALVAMALGVLLVGLARVAERRLVGWRPEAFA
jgi:ABC-type nitrate/sulfonate/bicarbonate transport system permease component